MAGTLMFADDFLNSVAIHIWDSARMHAQELSSGSSLNSQRQVARIKHELQGAATVVATAMFNSQVEIKNTRQLVGEAKGETREAKRLHADLKKEHSGTLRELTRVQAMIIEMAPDKRDEVLGITPTAAKKAAAKKDTVKKDTVKKDTVKKDTVKKDTVKKPAVKKQGSRRKASTTQAAMAISGQEPEDAATLAARDKLQTHVATLGADLEPKPSTETCD